MSVGEWTAALMLGIAVLIAQRGCTLRETLREAAWDFTMKDVHHDRDDA